MSRHMNDKIRKKELEYGAKALAYAIQQNAGQKVLAVLPTIKLGSAEWQAWERYFIEHLGFEPFAMKRARAEEGREMTVPAQWPEWFDSGFSSVNAA
jgi:hypothetical protein